MSSCPFGIYEYNNRISCEHMSSFLLGENVGRRLLNHGVNVCSTL